MQPAHTDVRNGPASGSAHDPPGPAIEVTDLVKVYQTGKTTTTTTTTTTALDRVSFSVNRGEIFDLLGPNGSGKTTTVRILVTLLHKTSGAARVGGFDTDRQPDQVRQLIGYAGQSIGVDDDLTAAENLALGGLLHHIRHDAAWKRTAELLDTFSLTEVASQRAGRLSGGMRRRLDLAQALVHRPSVLFLDEPTTGLDPQSRRALTYPEAVSAPVSALQSGGARGTGIHECPARTYGCGGGH